MINGKTNKNSQSRESTVLFEIKKFTMANTLFYSVENYDRNVFVLRSNESSQFNFQIIDLLSSNVMWLMNKLYVHHKKIVISCEFAELFRLATSVVKSMNADNFFCNLYIWLHPMSLYQHWILSTNGKCIEVTASTYSVWLVLLFVMRETPP